MSFAILESAIGKALPGVTLINPASAAAKAMAKMLDVQNLLSESKMDGEIRYFVSDEPARFATEGKIFLGKDFEIKAEKIEIDKF